MRRRTEQLRLLVTCSFHAVELLFQLLFRRRYAIVFKTSVIIHLLNRGKTVILI